MKITVLLFLAGAYVAVGLPAEDRSRRPEQTPEPSNAGQSQQNFGFGGFPQFGQFGNGGGSWPMVQSRGFGQPWSQSPFSAKSGGFDFNLPKGADGVSATAGMSCSFENGKKKCTNH
ncbi:uncharacterized protein LOC109411439 isoform X2 [Aedes albopictus]|uniref:Gly-rich secreted peptide n=1 Tax=Aedes albopictus TaxID=7160 RepID=A0ABM1YLS9_AEDAL|nr:uncharacterized protein LOC109411439 isoform X2 [Aedes albopictus]XP_029732150.1 uncharacterized protein LOC109428983 isoform X2 [Aedes albopictus]